MAVSVYPVAEPDSPHRRTSQSTPSLYGLPSQSIVRIPKAVNETLPTGDQVLHHESSDRTTDFAIGKYESEPPTLYTDER